MMLDMNIPNNAITAVTLQKRSIYNNDFIITQNYYRRMTKIYFLIFFVNGQLTQSK